MSMKRVVIVDYGVGNLCNLERAIRSFGVSVVISEEADVIRAADAIILPGVGAFASGMRGLEVRGLIPTLADAARDGKPILGICLGAQILLTTGSEFGTHQGLGLIPGSVVPFPPLPAGVKIPHIGWNTLAPANGAEWKGTILDSTRETDAVYFVHSFILAPDDSAHALAETTYGEYPFCSAVRRGNIYGCQFHPEKSGPVGLAILKNFLRDLTPDV